MSTRRPRIPSTTGDGFRVENAVELLARDIDAVLVAEPLGLSCDLLARRVRRRRCDVLAVLTVRAQFVHDGHTRGSRWRLDASGRDGTEWDGITDETPAQHPSRASRRVSVVPDGVNGGVA